MAPAALAALPFGCNATGHAQLAGNPPGTERVALPVAPQPAAVEPERTVEQFVVGRAAVPTSAEAAL
eukprot:4000985-Alexandrium_andersonii.AAC.1